MAGAASLSNLWQAVKGDGYIMEDNRLLFGSPYSLAGLTRTEAYDVRGESHLVRVWEPGPVRTRVVGGEVR